MTAVAVGGHTTAIKTDGSPPNIGHAISQPPSPLALNRSLAQWNDDLVRVGSLSSRVIVIATDNLGENVPWRIVHGLLRRNPVRVLLDSYAVNVTVTEQRLKECAGTAELHGWRQTNITEVAQKLLMQATAIAKNCKSFKDAMIEMLNKQDEALNREELPHLQRVISQHLSSAPSNSKIVVFVNKLLSDLLKESHSDYVYIRSKIGVERHHNITVVSINAGEAYSPT